jgi:hypothetical protein
LEYHKLGRDRFIPHAFQLIVQSFDSKQNELLTASLNKIQTYCGKNDKDDEEDNKMAVEQENFLVTDVLTPRFSFQFRQVFV